MSIEHRGFVVLGVGTAFVLGMFMFFVTLGWPGDPNDCINKVPDECFCEHFVKADVIRGAPGVRQPVNTWGNLYALLTASLVAIVVYVDRKKYGQGTAPNLIKSRSWMPDVYIFAVLFLGLGSMWFHASLTKWGGKFDGLSMYLYAAFLIFYTVRRLWNNAVFFWLAYLGTVILYTALHDHIPSVVLIVSMVVVYVAFEIVIWVRTKKPFGGTVLTGFLWCLAVVAILTATVFWKLSFTDGSMCDPLSKFQPHGLLWHPLAGVMAVLLYFYWREADEPVTVESGWGEL